MRDAIGDLWIVSWALAAIFMLTHIGGMLLQGWTANHITWWLAMAALAVQMAISVVVMYFD